MYPLKFKSIYIEKIWAGEKIKNLKADIGQRSVGISWEFSGHKNADSIIQNGIYTGMSFSQLLEKEGEKLIGTKINKCQILRAAILDARESLSLQVHPHDEYARIHENDNGKNETWYIMDADEEAYITAGTTTQDVKVLRKAVLDGNLEDYVVKVPVKKGDITVIKTGLLHALGKGILAVEIGENGDTTYRFYDYNRGRKLDIEKSFDVLRPEQQCFKPQYISISYDGYSKSYCYLGSEYALELFDIDTIFEDESDIERYYIYTCVEGQCNIKYSGVSEKVKMGESVFIPATLGKYYFEGKCRLIKSYIPDIDKVKDQIMTNITI